MILWFYDGVEYFFLVICKGMVKKMVFKVYDLFCQVGVIVVNFCIEDDEFIGVEQCFVVDDVLFISCKG